MRGLRPVTQLSRRAFSSSTSNRAPPDVVDLAFTRHEPPKKPSPTQLASPIIVMHGLFGSQRNNRTFILAQKLNRNIYNLDLRNHGDSPHHPLHTYTTLSQDVEHFLTTHSLTRTHNIKPILLGHSMGAKTAMTLALRNPQSYSACIPVDNAPVDAALKSDFGTYLTGMQEIETLASSGRITRQSDADTLLQKYESSLPIRQFLLTNFIKDPSDPTKKKMHFRNPLSTLSRSLDAMADFPFTDPDKNRFEGPTLVIRGGNSHYVADETLPIFGRFFPRFELVTVEGAGHWVISERFEESVAGVVEWVGRVVDGVDEEVS